MYCPGTKCTIEGILTKVEIWYWAVVNKNILAIYCPLEENGYYCSHLSMTISLGHKKLNLDQMLDLGKFWLCPK